MFFMGLLGWLQMIWLPGFLITEFFQIAVDRALKRFSYGFGLSILFNYILAFYATVFGVFNRYTVLALLVVECGLLVLIGARKQWKFNVPSILKSIKAFSSENGLLSKAITFAGISIIGVFFYYFIKNIGTVFVFADEVGSYNNWAVQWTKGNFPNPAATMRYPLVSSANWAVLYLLQGSEQLQFFPKLFSIFFPITCGLLFFDLAITRKDASYLIGLIFFGVILRILIPRFIGEGTMDLPVACIGFMTYHSMLEAEGKETKTNLLLVALFATLASVVKQSGIIVVCLVTLWWLFAQKHSSTHHLVKNRIHRLWIFIIPFVAITLSWYGMLEYKIYEGMATSESQFLLKGIHAGRTSWERLLFALDLLFGGGPIYYHSIFSITAMVGLEFLAFVSMLKAEGRRLMLCLILPYFFLWAFFFSYEVRVYSLAFPFLALTASFGVSAVCNLPPLNVRVFHQTLRRRTALGISFVAVIAVLLVSLTIGKSEHLIAREKELRKQILDSVLNSKLYEEFKVNGFSGKIATHYGMLRYLPDIDRFYFSLKSGASLELLHRFEAREDIHYLLIRNKETQVPLVHEDAKQYISEQISMGHYRLIFDHGNFQFIKIR